MERALDTSLNPGTEVGAAARRLGIIGALNQHMLGDEPVEHLADAHWTDLGLS